MGTRIGSRLVAHDSSAFSMSVDGIGENDPRVRGQVVGQHVSPDHDGCCASWQNCRTLDAPGDAGADPRVPSHRSGRTTTRPLVHAACATATWRGLGSCGVDAVTVQVASALAGSGSGASRITEPLHMGVSRSGCSLLGSASILWGIQVGIAA